MPRSGSHSGAMANNPKNEAKSAFAMKKPGHEWMTRVVANSPIHARTSLELEASRLREGSPLFMNHPLRSLLYDLFVSPPLGLLQRAFGRNRRASVIRRGADHSLSLRASRPLCWLRSSLRASASV